MTLNKAYLEPVLKWLDAGAPHDLSRGMQFQMRSILNLPFETSRDQNWCGTACCIAGAVIAFNATDLVLERIKEEEKEHEDSRSLLEDYGFHLNVWDDAVALLGMRESQASLLFAPFDQNDEDIHHYLMDMSRAYGKGDSPDVNYNRWPGDADAITPAWAARTIRHLIETGEVRWDLTHDDALVEQKELAES